MRILFLVALLSGLVTFPLAASEHGRAGPVVYQDQHVTVRASFMDVDTQVFHLGDVIPLLIQLEYNPNRARIANLDNALIERSWGNESGFSLQGEPRVFTTPVGRDRQRVRAIYGVQILDCPQYEFPCPGSKEYSYDPLVLHAELVGDDGAVVTTREMSFRPWPGSLALASVLPLPDGELADFEYYFPRGPFVQPVDVEVRSGNGGLGLLLGGLLLVGGTLVAPSAAAWTRRLLRARGTLLGRRWEKVIHRLETESLPDYRFWEGVRVAVVWYCNDELGYDAFQWLADDETEVEERKELDPLKAIFMDAIVAGDLDEARRKNVLAALNRTLERL